MEARSFSQEWLPSCAVYEAGEPLDTDKLQNFVARIHAHLIAQRLKGFAPLVWVAEDIIWHAPHPPA